MEYAESVPPSVLDLVVLLRERPDESLRPGQVGTVVEILDNQTALIEFSDEQGRAYAVVPCRYADLLVLHFAPQAA